jgi:hypothetical protein
MHRPIPAGSAFRAAGWTDHQIEAVSKRRKAANESFSENSAALYV